MMQHLFQSHKADCSYHYPDYHTYMCLYRKGTSETQQYPLNMALPRVWYWGAADFRQYVSFDVCKSQARRDMTRSKAMSGVCESAVYRQLERHAYCKVEDQSDAERAQPGQCRRYETERKYVCIHINSGRKGQDLRRDAEDHRASV